MFIYIHMQHMHISGFQNRAWGSLTGFLCGSFRGSVEVYRISGFGAQVLGFRFRFRVAVWAL